jgi:hypothetical protein
VCTDRFGTRHCSCMWRQFAAWVGRCPRRRMPSSCRRCIAPEDHTRCTRFPRSTGCQHMLEMRIGCSGNTGRLADRGAHMWMRSVKLARESSQQSTLCSLRLASWLLSKKHTCYRDSTRFRNRFRDGNGLIDRSHPECTGRLQVPRDDMCLARCRIPDGTLCTGPDRRQRGSPGSR